MRAGRTAAALLVLLLAAQPLLVLIPAGAAPGGTRSGDVLEVTTTHLVSGREEWDHVIVGEDAMLRVGPGGMMLTGTLSLGNGSVLLVVGGTLAVSNEDLLDPTDVRGHPREVLVTDGGLLIIEGRPGDDQDSNGKVSWCTLEVDERVLIRDSQVLLIGGEGLSPDAPVTEGQVDDRFEGGSSSLSIMVGPSGSGVSIVRSSIRVVGGSGGDAPDGLAPVGAMGGAAGGYTTGGNVSGEVGRGGSARLTIGGPRVSMLSSSIEVLGGDGGDAGDGGPAGDTAGGGGGGYSGGEGAGSQGPARGGGDVSGEVGAGGSAIADMMAMEYLQLSSYIRVAGGDGGDAGDGGDCDATRPDTVLGGGGGGGYSGGGGGAAGATEGIPGGAGGLISGMVGSGGRAEVEVQANLSTISGGEIEVTGGHGGRGGSAGTSTRGGSGWRAGGGGGSYSSGGGAGTSSSTWASGEGGAAMAPRWTVGSGGDAALVLDVVEATIPANASLGTTPGGGGPCLRTDAEGPAGGLGLGLVTRNGYLKELVPKAKVVLLSPDDGGVGSKVPTFSWAPAHPSTSAGRVALYEVQMDDDPGFRSPDLGFEVKEDLVTPGWVPNFTSYWKVRALYERPWLSPGPWSEPWTFTYINLPPTISDMPVFEVMVSQVTVIDLSPYVSDPDDDVDRLSLVMDHPNVLSTTRLNITVHFPEELGTVPLNFTLTDSLNLVDGQVMLEVTRYRHFPHISGLTNHKPPFELKVFEGTEAWYDVFVHDVDSDEFTYWTTGSWEGAEAFPNGTVRIRGERGDVGDHTFTLWVADEGGREDSMRVYVEVLNVNDPPDPPSIVSPNRRVTIGVGEMVSFSAVVSDPDLKYGQVLNVSFISNETGVFKTLRTTTLAVTDYDLFTIGQHVVTVVVDDGQYSSSDQVVVTVEEPPTPPPVSTPGSEGPSMWVYIVASVVLFAVGFSAGHLQMRRRRGHEAID